MQYQQTFPATKSRPISDVTSTYSYDGAGRLVEATIPHNDLTYGYAASGGRGANPNAGQDGDRTSMTDSLNDAAPSSVNYCYDNADRLTGSSVTNPPAGATPLGRVANPAGEPVECRGEAEAGVVVAGELV